MELKRPPIRFTPAAGTPPLCAVAVPAPTPADVYTLGGVRCVDADGEVWECDTAQEFWCRHAEAGTPPVVYGHYRRDHALVGDPLFGSPIGDAGAGSYLWRSAHPFRVNGVEALHPLRPWTAGLSVAAVATYMAEWSDLCRAEGLGNVEPTLARQSVASLAAHQRRTKLPMLHTHTSEALQRWERRACAYWPPVRVAGTGTHEMLWHVDFNAFYPSIMASAPMPNRVVDFAGILDDDCRGVPAGLPADTLLLWEDSLGCFGTADPPADVVAWAAYTPSALLASWAQWMLSLRQRFPDVVMLKAVANCLWGKLQQRSFSFGPPQPWHDLGVDDAALYGLDVDTVSDGTVTHRVGTDGVEVCDAHAFEPNRNVAVGAFVRAEASRRMGELMGRVGGDVVEAHTDSVRSTAPVNTAGLDVAATVERDVAYRDGIRFLSGVVDAHAGTPVGGQQRWTPFSPGLAAMEITEEVT